LDCALEVYAKERRVFVMNHFALQCMFQNDIRRAWRNMPQLVSQLLFHTIHDACRIFDKVVAFLVLLWGKVRTGISFVPKSQQKIQNANRNLYTCNIQLRQVRLCKRFIVYVLHRTTWLGSIVSLECIIKATITGICWWDFIKTHAYHIIQNTIFPQKIYFT